MFSIKHLIYPLFLTFAILFLRLGFAQKEPAYMEREGEKGEEVQAIDSGYVVAYGKLLSRPYYVTISDDTIRINGVAYSPKPPNPNPPVYPQPSDTSLRIAALMTEMQEVIFALYKDYPAPKAREMVLQQYSKNPLVSEIKYDDKMKQFHVIFFDRRVGWSFDTEEKIQPLWMPSPEEREANRKSYQEGIQWQLRHGQMILFAYSYTMTIHREDGDNILGIVCDIKRGIIGAEGGKSRLMDVLKVGGGESYEEKIVQDIIDNVSTWNCNSR
jgi:hypothetical protein